MEENQKKPLSDADLLSYNQQGLIPSPEESEKDFLARVQTCLGLKELLTNEGDQALPFKAEIPESSKILEEAFTMTRNLYDISPFWLPIFFSNYQLTPWHGGCAWIFQLQEDSPQTAFLQLRKAFAYQKTYLKIYSRSELIAHECAHVGRMAFNQEQFEEILAYRTSRSRFTRWLGPIVQSAKESLVFIGSLLILFLLDLYFLFTENHEAYLSFTWLKIFPLGLIVFALIRLWRRHQIFKRSHTNLIKVVGDKKTADHIIFRLTDDEIVSFSKLSPDKIIEYAKKQPTSSLRWRLLNLAYFSLSKLKSTIE